MPVTPTITVTTIVNVLLQNPGERKRLAVVCLNIKIDFSFFF